MLLKFLSRFIPKLKKQKGGTMKTRNVKEMTEIIQSSHLNFLIGAGLSTPFLPVLNDIEIRLQKETDDEKRIQIYKEYITGTMLPNKDVIDGSEDRNDGSNFRITYDNYRKFFETISFILLKRKSTILSKQANIFTTNIDVLMETVLEECNLNYNDGFLGQINPVFGISNFKKSISKRSLHFENISEIPVFNLIKVHGSLTWKKDRGNIVFSKLDHFDKSLIDKEGESFKKKYNEILIVNPQAEKFEKTVFDLIYYELLRMYSSELEKENVVLFVMGFSFADEHIQEITVRSANSNPTLKVYIFCYDKNEFDQMKKNIHYDKLRYANVEIICPEDDSLDGRYSLKNINESVFKNIFPKNREMFIEE